MRVAILIASLWLAAAPAIAREFPVITVEGLLVDLLCYTKQIAAERGGGEPADPTACPSTNPMHPVALVEMQADRRLWTLASPPLYMSKHVLKRARVTGEQFSATVIKTDRIEIEEAGTWVEVPSMPEM